MLNLVKKLSLSLCLLVTCAWVQANDIKTIDQQSVLTAEDLVIVDVRTPEEFAKGHVPGAINVPVAEFADNLHMFADKNQNIVTYCRSGRRAMQALEVLQANGYTDLHHLEGDIREWEAAELPLTVPPSSN